jgi:hypothetical protein
VVDHLSRLATEDATPLTVSSPSAAQDGNVPPSSVTTPAAASQKSAPVHRCAFKDIAIWTCKCFAKNPCIAAFANSSRTVIVGS